ncbi:uncharacterized protein TRIREDRAFT_120402 [Trichoderma reesei QM6a]|uniref:Predicted protein n=2 Tax=Hypocrea jecorina TaxID=51453 RepID=G0RC33_HYPJQ|nr:uncharacterized protein TRIREDRAFT_120402 [Trichoderma reesei QM6a]EGR51155.1 predicted protein [Trichoderma reesei QM6a]ETS04602.1 sure-like protein [Trichoderma reesei RUT C-30]
MHILVSNDDGPPSPHSSPYVHSFVRHLQKAGHTVSVCVPHTQRSWIGKAHLIGQTLKPVYYRPSAHSHGDDAEGTTHARPSPSGAVEEWILIDGTPASCVQIGLNHFFQDRGPVDLVVSGPNFGRNSTAIFALSSGTLGAALEAAGSRYKAIALSFAFFSRNHDPVIIDAACRHSVRVIEYLYKQWPTDGSADLYSVNVPLVEGVETHQTVWTDILQNYWTKGGCFDAVDGSADDEDLEEERIREGPGGEVDGEADVANAPKGHTHKHFKWAPKFAEVYKSVEEAGPGSDGWAVKEGQTSVTPLKANFATCAGDRATKEIKLPDSTETPTTQLAVREKPKEESKSRIQAIVSYDDPYVQPLIVSALNAVLPKDSFDLITDISPENFNLSSMLPSPDTRVLEIVPYESIDFEFASSHTKTCLINSYMIRKALIRKHYLSATLDHWAAKNPDSILKKHLKRSEAFEVDYAEFLDDALVEAFDLRESMDRNEDKEPSEREWWILKPGMSDRGQGIRLFSTMEELQDIFDGWEEERPDSDDEEEIDDDDEAPGGGAADEDAQGDYITASHLRHFVAQPYIHPPLLLSPVGGHKFHIRTYVLCTGSLDVYVYKHMLALFAGKPYTPPWTAPDDIEAFLTNTCLQDSPNENTVRRFWELPLERGALEAVFEQVCGTTGEVFEAAARAMPIHFQTLPNAFEVFGLDFLVDADGEAWLLEVNAFPDFKQTGGDLRGIVEGFWRGVVGVAVGGFFGVDGVKREEEDGDMVSVRRVDLGRR